MASISGLGGTNSLRGIRGYGGLASGLDRDSLIEDMTYGTTSKIEQQRQKKLLLQWKQDAIRNVSTKMIDFANKYTATMASSTNLFSSAFWGKSTASALGANSKLVSVSGVLRGAKDLSVLGVKQMAKNARWTSKVETKPSFETGEIKAFTDIQNLEGKTIRVKYGSDTYTVDLTAEDGYNYKDAASAAAAIENAFSKVDIGNDKTLKDVLQTSASADGKISFTNIDKDENKLVLRGGTALKYLGMDDGDFEETELKKGVAFEGKAIDKNDLITTVSLGERVAGKELNFRYNGKMVTVKLPGKDEFTGDYGKDLEMMRASIQKQFDDQIGSERVRVDLNKDLNGLRFETVKRDDNGKYVSDDTSVLSLVGGSSALVGENGALGIKVGTSNRVNMDAKLSDLGVTATEFKVNGKTVKIDAEKETVRSLMEKINNETDIEISYQEVTGKFMITAKQDGAGGKIDIDSDTMNAFGAIFGFGEPDENGKLAGIEEGQDAVIRVKYGDAEAFEITRGSNSFDLDGLNVSVKGEFGYDKASGKWDESAEAVTFDVRTDTEPILNGIKDMVKEYNEIIELVNKEVSTKPNRDYPPLTAEQKKELSEDEIKLYEEKAKEGMLFGDSDFRSLSNALRFAISPSDLSELEKIGLTVSNSYTDNGKLVLDEEKFKAALEQDPDKVKELFTKKKGTDENGNAVASDGIAVNLKNVMDQYVKTIGATKGILIEKAGSVKAPASITKNALYKQMVAIDNKISDLQYRLKMEQDRYIKQFTSLENIISQMNAQSGWLSQFGGGY